MLSFSANGQPLLRIGRIKTTIRSECGFHMNSIAGLTAVIDKNHLVC
jgi:hypothetical protein